MRNRTSIGGGGPRFSIVSAVYNVAGYLDEFIASIEAQTFPLADVEVILVDDGSVDDSGRLIDAWQARRPELVTVLRKENGGQASARNLGLEHARGEWITFTDPDDMLEPDALSEIAAFVDKYPKTQLAAMRRELLIDSTGKRARHPLESHFRSRNRLLNLDEHPRFFYASAPCAFFRRSEIERLGLRFHEDIRPSFEDGYFCCEYLLNAPAPMVGFVASATYVYRKRADESSTLSQGKKDVRRYTTLLRLGLLGIMKESVRLRGSVPPWLQTLMIYELGWFLGAEEQVSTPKILPVLDEVHENLRDITSLLDERWIREFSLRRLRPEWRDILVHGFTGVDWHTPFAVTDRVDWQQRLMRVTYRYIGEAPAEEFLVNGVPTAPLHGKVRSQLYFQRTIIRHRVAWLPYGSLEVRLDGQAVPVSVDEPQPDATVLDGWRARNKLVPRFEARDTQRERDRLKRDLRDRLVLRLARTKVVRRFFANAWVLMDRLHDADDSAEHLFRYLRDKQPKVNAWFVIERGADDAKQLRKDGHRRIVAPDTLRWKLLMLNCSQLISSHADAPITAPPAITKLVKPQWRFVFLQHGVTKDDLSGWLNPKQMSIFVVSTPAEYESVVADDTAYDYTSKETQLTGLPRFDRVLAAGAKYPPDKRDLVLVAPTWRQWLVNRAPGGNQKWTIDPEEFLTSEFAQNWRAFLTSPELAAELDRTGLKLGVLMHPNLQAVVPHLDLPKSVELLDFSGDVRTTFARARVLVTDYSSMAFNAAYIERPVVYFMFDREVVLGGGHVGRRGYFDYERDGYGPVTVEVDAAVKATVEAIATGPAPDEEYLRRIEAAFPLRDGRCCERVYEAIVASTRRYRPPVATEADSAEPRSGDSGFDDLNPDSAADTPSDISGSPVTADSEST